MKNNPFRLAALASACLLAVAPAFAKDHGEGNGHGKGHGKGNPHKDKGRAEQRHDDVRPGAFFDDRNREVARRYYSEHYGRGGKGCPPGLARKNNGCMPPGQARKWGVGQPIPRGVAVYEVPRPVLVQLPPPPYGYHYARIGPDIVLVRNNNNLVIDIIVNVFG